ncbi:MAG: hypothetical protein ACD_49C00038G0046 [uncultured bacterium (gcode 4)]|uniref:Uncharacterized protein n=1 Tax=uncultured bacterium (gcode 4) TaxID=1234023 RepID=K2AXM6_9BACT|nr:MAG: hypothetical protein ACD_49C00038G0046 [uncultured bacterium (gcode 4)]
MMGYNYMMGGNIGIMFIFSWLIYVLVIILLVLCIIALRKYINKM